MLATVLCVPLLTNGQASPASAPTATQIEKPLVLIDAAHGGSDSGALLTPSVPEKDITLNVARRLRQELSARGISSQLLRDGDTTLSADQRASIVNAADPALYLTIHTSSYGTGLRVFTVMPQSQEGNKGPFAPWDLAQSPVLKRSKAIQLQILAAISKMRFPTRALSAPVRPLNNVRVPGLGIEISPTTGDAVQVASAGYQQMICAAVANAIASIAPSIRSTGGTNP